MIYKTQCFLAPPIYGGNGGANDFAPSIKSGMGWATTPHFCRMKYTSGGRDRKFGAVFGAYLGQNKVKIAKFLRTGEANRMPTPRNGLLNAYKALAGPTTR